MVVQCQKCGSNFETFPCHVKAGGAKGTLCPACRPTREDRKKQIAASCAQCGSPFTVKECEVRNNSTGRFYCTRKCMGAWRSVHLIGEAHHNFKAKIEVACSICGKTKSVYECNSKRQWFFCSGECRGEWIRRRNPRPSTRVAVPCAQCGIGVNRLPTSKYEKAFCGPTCHGLWRSTHGTGADNPNYRGGKEFPCEVCGKPVWVKPSHFNERRHYCSGECSDSVAGKFTSGELSPRWNGGTVKRECAVCGTPFEIKQAEAERAVGRYCSRRCAGRAHQSTESSVCQHCGAPFGIVPSQIGKARFCSRECQHASRRIPKPMRKLHARVHQLVYRALKKNKAGYRWEHLVGYTVDELKRHIESLFWPGMSWENMGEWHIDHCVPRSAFRFTKPTDPQFIECWSLSNLQPLWKLDNLRKSSRLGFVRGQIVPREEPQPVLQ